MPFAVKLGAARIALVAAKRAAANQTEPLSSFAPVPTYFRPNAVPALDFSAIVPAAAGATNVTSDALPALPEVSMG